MCTHSISSVLKALGALFLILLWGICISGCSPSGGYSEEATSIEELIAQAVESEYEKEEEPDLENLAIRERLQLTARLRELPPQERELEIRLFALNIYHEAQGEGELGWIAVGNVMRNRERSPRYPNTVQGVVEQQNRRGCQFSWYCDGRFDAVATRDVKSGLWDRIYKLSEEMLLEDLYRDTTNGSLHYFNAKKANPYWAQGKTPTARIGDHWFYNNIS